MEEVKTMTCEEAGKMLHKSAEFIRAVLRQGKVDWGTATEGKNGTWNYVIIKSKFYKWVEIPLEKEVKVGENK